MSSAFCPGQVVEIISPITQNYDLKYESYMENIDAKKIHLNHIVVMLVRLLA